MRQSDADTRGKELSPSAAKRSLGESQEIGDTNATRPTILNDGAPTFRNSDHVLAGDGAPCMALSEAAGTRHFVDPGGFEDYPVAVLGQCLALHTDQVCQPPVGNSPAENCREWAIEDGSEKREEKEKGRNMP